MKNINEARKSHTQNEIGYIDNSFFNEFIRVINEQNRLTELHVDKMNQIIKDTKRAQLCNLSNPFFRNITIKKAVKEIVDKGINSSNYKTQPKFSINNIYIKPQ